MPQTRRTTRRANPRSSQQNSRASSRQGQEPTGTRSSSRGRDQGRQGSRSTRRTKKKKESSGFKGWVMWLVIAVPISIGMSMCEQSQDNVEIMDVMMDNIASFPNYDQKKTYYRKLVRSNHQAAFDATYRLGRRTNEFDNDKYLVHITKAMLKDAQGDGEDEVVGYLRMYLMQVQ